MVISSVYSSSPCFLYTSLLFHFAHSIPYLFLYLSPHTFSSPFHPLPDSPYPHHVHSAHQFPFPVTHIIPFLSFYIPSLSFSTLLFARPPSTLYVYHFIHPVIFPLTAPFSPLYSIPSYLHYPSHPPLPCQLGHPSLSLNISSISPPAQYHLFTFVSLISSLSPFFSLLQIPLEKCACAVFFNLISFPFPITHSITSHLSSSRAFPILHSPLHPTRESSPGNVPADHQFHPFFIHSSSFHLLISYVSNPSLFSRSQS